MNNEILIAFIIVFLFGLNLFKNHKIKKLNNKINSLKLKNNWLIKLKKPY